jgi:transposase
MPKVKKRKAGRPTVMQPQLVDRLCEALGNGNWREVACAWAGISSSTFRNWMAKGEAEKVGRFRDFRRRVLEAEQSAEIRAVQLVMQAAENDARHAEWFLERKFPERWGRKDRHELTGAGGGPVVTESLSQLSREELLAIASLPLHGDR